MKYRIKHKPSGLYVKPIDVHSDANLVTKEWARIYDSEKIYSTVVGKMYYKGGLRVEGEERIIYIDDRDEFEKEYVSSKTDPHIFVARDKSGGLFCFPDKPIKDEESGQYKCSEYGLFIPIQDNKIFRSITWETGPKILLLKDVIEC